MKKLLVLAAVAACVFAVLGQSAAYAMQVVDGEKIKLDFYGKLYFDGFYTSASENHFSGLPGKSRRSGFEYNILNFSKVGLKAKYDKIEGVAEFGTTSDSVFRLLYFQYSFDNGGRILIGQAATIAGYSFGQLSYNQNCLIDYGALDNPRRPMIKYSIAGFEAALIAGKGLPITGQDPSYDYFTKAADALTAARPGSKVAVVDWIPRLELAYNISSTVFNGKFFGSYAPYVMQSKSIDGGYKDYYTNTFSVGFGGRFDFGNLFVMTTAYYGMNLTLTKNLYNPTNPVVTMESNNALTIKNVQSAGGAVGIGYKVNSMITPQIGAGFSSAFGGPIADNDDAFGVYANVTITFNEWLALTPEIAYLDNMYDGNGNKQGSKLFAGAQLEVSF